MLMLYFKMQKKYDLTVSVSSCPSFLQVDYV